MRLALIACLGFAAGCSNSSEPAASSAPTGPTFNQPDVDFVIHMSQHHAQALQMAELATGKARSTGVRTFARRIIQAQGPEMDQLGAWLAEWGEAGAQMPPHGSGSDPGGPGMLTQAQISRLETLSAAPFDRLFLDLMIRHHRGGLQLTKAQLEGGRNESAVRLAQEIQDATHTEISEMVKIRQTLPV